MTKSAYVFSTTILLLVAAAATPAQEKPQAPPPAPDFPLTPYPYYIYPICVR